MGSRSVKSSRATRVRVGMAGMGDGARAVVEHPQGVVAALAGALLGACGGAAPLHCTPVADANEKKPRAAHAAVRRRGPPLLAKPAAAALGTARADKARRSVMDAIL